jgi:hypothetical protein
MGRNGFTFLSEPCGQKISWKIFITQPLFHSFHFSFHKYFSSYNTHFENITECNHTPYWRLNMHLVYYGQNDTEKWFNFFFQTLCARILIQDTRSQMVFRFLSFTSRNIYYCISLFSKVYGLQTMYWWINLVFLTIFT